MVGDPDRALLEEASSFAEDVADLLQSTVVDDVPVRAHVRGSRVVVAALDDDGGAIFIPLRIKGCDAARLRVEFECVWDREGKFLAVEESRYAVLSSVIAEPILRIEYLRQEPSPVRAAHIHVHGECTQLGALYAAAGVEMKANLQRLHFPVGGKRFRPCLEDVIEFLVTELRVDAKDGWAARVAEGRTRWYRLQLAATIREYEAEAVKVLKRLGYSVDRSAPIPS